jgi:hypothetical protein
MGGGIHESAVREQIVVRQLSERFPEIGDPQGLDDALRSFARACWARAGETADPYADDSAARELILKALTFAVARSRPSDAWRDLAEARAVFRAGRFSMPGAPKKHPEHSRVHRTILVMADCLWSTWIVEPARACEDGGCLFPLDCPTTEGLRCARTLVFPYLNDRRSDEPEYGIDRLVRVPNHQRTARAVHIGLQGLKDSGAVPYVPDEEAVRAALRRA